MATYTYDAISGTYVLSADQSFGVTTDQLDYAPGTTATISAAGFSAGDIVEITAQVVEANGTLDAITFDTTVTIGADGTAMTTMFIDPALYTNQSILLTATDLTAGVMATEMFADAPPPPPPEPTVFGYVDGHIDLTVQNTSVTQPVTGAIFDNSGTPIMTPGSSGTGVFHTFSEVQSDGSEQGFNTEVNGVMDEKSSNVHNHQLHLTDLVAVDQSGAAITSATPAGTPSYYEFKLDIHQDGSHPFLSLDGLQIWQSSTANLGNGTFATTGDATGSAPSFGFNSGVATKVYDLGSESVLLDSAFTAGSGGGSDLVVLIPTTDFNPLLGNDVYLYSAFGFQGGDWAANSTFEEWGALVSSSSTIIGGGQNPELGIAKTVVSAPPNGSGDIGPLADHSGETITYQVVLSNTGTADATNVTLSDSLVDLSTVPVSFTDTGAADHAAYGSLAAAEAAGVLDVGETWTLTYTYSVQQSDLNNNGNDATNPGFIDNTVTATSTELPPVSSSASVLVDRDPSWAVFKDVAVSAPHDSSDSEAAQPVESHPFFTVPAATVVDIAGQTLSYTVTLQNTGNVDIAGSDIVVTDSYESGAATFLYNLGTVAGVALTSSDGNKTTFDVGATWTFTYTHTVGQGEINSNGGGDGVLSNTVTASTVDTVLTTQTASTSVVVDQDPSINVEKIVSVDGGVNWYTLNDANDSASTLGTISSETGIAIGNLHYGSPTLTNHAGNPSPMYEFVITNTGNVDLNNVTLSDSLYSNVSIASGTSLLVGADTIVKITEPFHAGDNFDTATVTGQIDSGSITVTDTDNADYLGFALGTAGLTQGFWSTHTAAWDGKSDTTWGNIVDKPGGLFGDAFTASTVAVTASGNKFIGNDDILFGLPGHGGGGTVGGVLLGDANGNGVVDTGEVTMALTNSVAVADLSASSTGNSQTIMLNQLIAAQLNIYNGDQDPGSYMLSTNPGHDLVGEAVQWLKGTLLNEPKDGAGGTVKFLTSDAAWTSKFFDTGIANPNNVGHDIMVSGQDIKNVLQAFDQGNIVTSANDQSIGWTSDGGVTVVGVHPNTPDEFWLVALQHGVITG